MPDSKLIVPQSYAELRRAVRLLGLLLAMVQAIFAAEETVHLPVFRVEGTPWQYARLGEVEVLTRASLHQSRAMITALLRGHRLLPDFYTQGVELPLKVLLVEERSEVIAGLKKPVRMDSDERHWRKSYYNTPGSQYETADQERQLVAANLADDPVWEVLMIRAQRLVAAQSPAFPVWVRQGLFGRCGPLQHVIGLPKTATVQIAKHSWPDAAVEPGLFPREAAEFPPFSVMFDSTRNLAGMTPGERRQFDFQTGLFARWSLFGPAKKNRNRNGYWALAEMARRGPVTEALFRECIGVDYATACSEMHAYLKSPAVGMIEVRMPQVMAEVPEAEQLEFRMATPEEAARILKNFTRLFPPEQPKSAP